MISKRSVFALARALEGVPILGTLDGSSASRAGLRYGDVLISVNGRRTRTVGEYIEAKNLRTDGMEIVVFRAGASLELSLEYDQQSTPNVTKIVANLIELRVGLEDSGKDPTGTA